MVAFKGFTVLTTAVTDTWTHTQRSKQY